MLAHLLRTAKLYLQIIRHLCAAAFMRSRVKLQQRRMFCVFYTAINIAR